MLPPVIGHGTCIHASHLPASNHPMCLKPTLALLGAMLSLTGCRSLTKMPETPLPPNTILLSQMMRELSAHPGFTEALLQELGGAQKKPGKRGPALLTPTLVNDLRAHILGKDWQHLDYFPGWTMREINPTVRVADRLAGKNSKLESLSAVHPGAPALNDEATRSFLDLGPYALNQSQTVSLNEPSTLPGFTSEGIVTAITPDITRGDGPNALAPEHAESQRLADILNRLSVNTLTGAEPFTATLNNHPAQTPEALVANLLATGHTVTVTDTRYFANFGHLHYKGMDVMMPFWINTELDVPGTATLFHRPRHLLVPVSHAEYEWHIRGSRINADVSHYFGVDGKAEWRTMDTLDQAWVLKRDAHTYTGAQAIEVTRLLGLITLAYMHQHARRPSLPFGGYYTLGVCQDPVSAIEKKLHGSSTLFPNTADGALFDDPRDAEVNALMQAIPKDRTGARPEPRRIFGSLPVEPGPDGSFTAVTIPGLAQDLSITYAAWQHGTLQHARKRLFAIAASTAAIFTLLVLTARSFHRRRSASARPTPQA